MGIIKSTFKIMITTFLIAFILVIGGLYALPKFIAQKDLKRPIENLVLEKTGKNMDINGNVKISIIPEISLIIDDANITDPNNKNVNHWLDLKTKIDILPLITNNIELVSIVTWDEKTTKANINISDAKNLKSGKSFQLSAVVKGQVDLDATTNLAIKQDNINFNNLVFSSRSTSGKGEIEIAEKGEVQNIVGNIAFDNLNVDEIQNTAKTIAAIASVFKKKEVAASPTNPVVTQSPKESKKLPWKKDSINLSWMKKLNANISVKANSIKSSRINLGKTKVKLMLENDLLTAQVDESSLYNGKGEGQITVDISKNKPSITKDFSLTGIKIGDYTRDAYGFDKLDGIGDINVSVSGKGNNELEMVSSLNGNGSIKIKDGLIKGVHIVSSLSPADIVSAFKSKKDTKIIEANASFKIKEGVITNDDLKLKVPFGNIKGSGEINLPEMTVDYQIKQASEDGKDALLKAPISIKGDLQKPKITSEIIEEIKVDVEKFIDANKEEIEEIKDSLKDFRKSLDVIFKERKKTTVTE